MNACEIAAGKDFDIGFLMIAFVKKWTRYCSGDGADLHHCAHATVQNSVFIGVDLGAEDGRGLLPSWYLELHGIILKSYVVDSVILRVERGAAGADVISADA